MKVDERSQVRDDLPHVENTLDYHSTKLLVNEEHCLKESVESISKFKKQQNNSNTTNDNQRLPTALNLSHST